MTHQSASRVVTAPLATVERQLRDVESWPAFLVGVDRIGKTSHERYLFRLHDGRRLREVRMLVRAHPREHRFSWKVLEGPAFNGTLHLTPTGYGWTRVNLTLTTHPSGLWAGLAEMVGPTRDRAVVDLNRLQDHVCAAPPPVDAPPGGRDPIG